MAMSDDERKDRKRQYQKKYRSSDKFKATRKRYEQSDYYREYKRQLAERTRGEDYLDYQQKYRETDAYKKSIKKYRQSHKYKERTDKSLIYTEFKDDGMNNDISPKHKILKRIENTMVEFTEQFIDDFCDNWIDWIEDSTFKNDGGKLMFRREVYRINYSQYVKYYKELKGVRVGLTQIEKEFLNNEYFRERMKEIDMLYEQQIESLMAQGLIHAVSSKFILTNRFKDKWFDSKTIKNETTIEKIVWNETLYVDAHVIEPSQLPPATPRLNTSNDDDFDFEDV